MRLGPPRFGASCPGRYTLHTLHIRDSTLHSSFSLYQSKGGSWGWWRVHERSVSCGRDVRRAGSACRFSASESKTACSAVSLSVSWLFQGLQLLYYGRNGLQNFPPARSNSSPTLASRRRATCTCSESRRRRAAPSTQRSRRRRPRTRAGCSHCASGSRSMWTFS